jgi:lysophospholipase L1-like esterase
MWTATDSMTSPPISSTPVRLVITFRIAAAITGLLLLAAALWGHHLGLGTAPRMGATRLLALITGAAMVGAAVVGPRLPRLYRTAALILLNSIILFFGLELAAALILKVTVPGESVAPPNDQRTSPYYQTKEWAHQYWTEFDQVMGLGVRYRPYVVSGWPSYQGKMIAIDQDGYRHTPGSECRKGALTVFFFGGSTSWGFGSPDWGTIPAYLVQDLKRILDRPICMRNLGQLGFVSTQSLLQLMRHLQMGDKPDLAIFYGGNNDIEGADQSGRAGHPWDNSRIAARVEAGEGANQPKFTELRWKSNLYQLVWRLTREPKPADPPIHHVSDSLADAVLRVYLENHRLAQALGREYGFQVASFWQPIIDGDAKPLTPDEQPFRRALIGSLSELVAARVSSIRKVDHLYDLTTVFAGRPELIYLDTHHITPEGNRLVAAAIAKALSTSGALGQALDDP